MTDPMELVDRLDYSASANRGLGRDGLATLLTEAAACIREMVERQAELADAARAYFVGWMLDEADDSGPIFTGCSTEQHLAAKRLGDALPPAPGAEDE